MAKSASEALLEWYARIDRNLPWRGEEDPYRVLVSETMLQQTRVEAAAARYDDFLTLFPDASALAEASEDELLKAWQGLGYYSRARNLQAACREIVGRCQGRIPRTARDLQRLPGVGPYTAAAVAAIAFGEEEPALDANAVRIFSRLIAMEESPGTADGRERLKSEMRAFMPAGRAADFTQAIMDLGQLACRPRNPKCAECPLTAFCEARKTGRPEQFPRRDKPTAKREESWTAILLTADERLALVKRPPKGLLASMYGPVMYPGTLSASDVRLRLRELGFEAEELTLALSWRHVFTHRIWNLTGYLARVAAPADVGALVWADQEALDSEYALPSAFAPAIDFWRRWRTAGM